MKKTLTCSLLLLVTVSLAGSLPLHAQTPDAPPSPYAGEETRTLKALSEAEVAQYLDGAGMGFAKAAELNSYPGPRHVLDLQAEIDLTPEQVQAVQAAFDTMHEEAVRLGQQIVVKEQALDTLFADSHAAPETVRALTDEIGALQGRLRFTHLNAHLQMKATLTDAQIRHYDHLRGYAQGTHHMQEGQGQHHENNQP